MDSGWRVGRVVMEMGGLVGYEMDRCLVTVMKGVPPPVVKEDPLILKWTDLWLVKEDSSWVWKISIGCIYMLWSSSCGGYTYSSVDNEANRFVSFPVDC